MTLGELGEGDLRRSGTVPHASFCLGFEPTRAYVTGLAKCATQSPSRTPENAQY
jgi:aspartyl/asparaginyl-tRNA synthetase